jgi:hypothetical protein
MTFLLPASSSASTINLNIFSNFLALEDPRTVHIHHGPSEIEQAVFRAAPALYVFPPVYSSLQLNIFATRSTARVHSRLGSGSYGSNVARATNKTFR